MKMEARQVVYVIYAVGFLVIITFLQWRPLSKAKQSKRSLDEGAGRSLYALQIK